MKTESPKRRKEEETLIKYPTSSAAFARKRATLPRSVGRQKLRAKAKGMDRRGKEKEKTEEAGTKAKARQVPREDAIIAVVTILPVTAPSQARVRPNRYSLSARSPTCPPQSVR